MATRPAGGPSSQKKPAKPDVSYSLGGFKKPEIDGVLQSTSAIAGDSIPGEGHGVQAAGTVMRRASQGHPIGQW
ncbi:hypothetical protein COCNU_contig69409807G000010 [Cocos nucifera]|nr:hypothetical protein [Cocos nucifera]